MSQLYIHTSILVAGICYIYTLASWLLASLLYIHTSILAAGMLYIHTSILAASISVTYTHQHPGCWHLLSIHTSNLAAGTSVSELGLDAWGVLLCASVCHDVLVKAKGDQYHKKYSTNLDFKEQIVSLLVSLFQLSLQGFVVHYSSGACGE